MAHTLDPSEYGAPTIPCAMVNGHPLAHQPPTAPIQTSADHPFAKTQLRHRAPRNNRTWSNVRNRCEPNGTGVARGPRLNCLPIRTSLAWPVPIPHTHISISLPQPSFRLGQSKNRPWPAFGIDSQHDWLDQCADRSTWGRRDTLGLDRRTVGTLARHTAEHISNRSHTIDQY